MTVDEQVRYNRQKLIWGEEGQAKIAAGKIAIIGAGPLAEYIALPLAALGVGQLRIIGTDKSEKEEYILDQKVTGTRSESIAKAVRHLNPTIDSISLNMPTNIPQIQDTLQNATIIIDATNSSRSKEIALEYAQEKNIPFLSVSAGQNHAKFMPIYRGGTPQAGHFMANYEGLKQNNIISLMWGGIIAEEIKKLLIQSETPLEKELHYAWADAERFKPITPNKRLTLPTNFRDKSALVIGAGALGNIACLGLSDCQFGSVNYLDYDTVESTNLNRQILFYDAIGKKKAEVLAQKHKIRDPNCDVRSSIKKLTFENGTFNISEKPSIIFDLVDNLYARALISAYAVQNDIPLVSAATSATAGRVITYIPGITASLDTVINGYYAQGKIDEIDRRQSCIRAPDSSVIVTNQIAGALGVLEAINVLSNKIPPVSGILKFDSGLEQRIGQTNISDIYTSQKNKDNIPDLTIAVGDPKDG